VSLAEIVARDAADDSLWTPADEGDPEFQPIIDRRELLALLRETRLELDFFVTDDAPDVKPEDMTTEDWDFGVLTWRAHEDRATALLALLAALDEPST
jgi:hypothetical protein